MKFLLDTHVMLWMLEDSASLSRKARALIEDGENELFWSAASFWELTVKSSLGKLKLAKDWIQVLEREKEENRVQDIPITWRHCRLHENLPWHHRDPFDRLLICQALSEGLTLLTKDRNIKKYRVKTAW